MGALSLGQFPGRGVQRRVDAIGAEAQEECRSETARCATLRRLSFLGGSRVLTKDAAPTILRALGGLLQWVHSSQSDALAAPKKPPRGKNQLAEGPVGKRAPLKKPWRFLPFVLITLAGLGAVLAVYSVAITQKDVAERDFISYWAAGRLLVNGQNPYDFQAVKTLELEAGRDPNQPLLMMRNPPVAFFLAMPLGLAGPKTSLIVWLLFLMAPLTTSILLIWRLNGKPESLLHLTGFLFAPALACLMAGQFGIVILFGMVLFLYLHQQHPFMAGAALSLCTLKPHYFGPFAVALLLWFVTRKSYRIPAGFCVAVVAICAFAYARDAHAWGQYAQMMHAGGALNEVIPQLSAQLRLLTLLARFGSSLCPKPAPAFGRPGTSSPGVPFGTGWTTDWCCCWWGRCVRHSAGCSMNLCC